MASKKGLVTNVWFIQQHKLYLVIILGFLTKYQYLPQLEPSFLIKHSLWYILS